MAIKRALISVSDKTGVVEFARRLAARGAEILSTGGTASALRAAGLTVTDVSEVTGFPEILGGRVKTLHPNIHAGLLAKTEDEEHRETLKEHRIEPIDLVAVNLYPFEKTVANPEVALADAIEQIDIGGPSMLRSAAKNFGRITVVCDPADYEDIAAEIEKDGDTSAATRARLAAKVFSVTSGYDAAIAAFLDRRSREETGEEDASAFPPVLRLALPMGQALRYGENPHQAAAFYRDPSCRETSLATAKQHQGKHLSYNNYLDAEGALEMVRDFADLAPAAAVIVKHSNPCGIALGETPLEAYDKARETDPTSAFGGIVALSCEVDGETAARIVETFNEVVIAPSYTADALEAFAKKKNLRILATGPFTPKENTHVVRGIVGGVLVTERDLGKIDIEDLNLVTNVTPNEADLRGLLFAWRCVKWVKSNAIVYTRQEATLGIGAGQMSRVDSAKFGAEKSQKPLQGCYMASDAFFPFRDSIDAAAERGVRAIIQPGGSVRDEEVIEAANEHAIVMVFTGMRHFRH